MITFLLGVFVGGGLILFFEEILDFLSTAYKDLKQTLSNFSKSYKDKRGSE